MDKEDRDGVVIHDSIGRQQKAVIINESGLYALILSSQLEQARAFKHWVTAEDTLRYLRQQTTMALKLTAKLEFIKGLMADPL